MRRHPRSRISLFCNDGVTGHLFRRIVLAISVHANMLNSRILEAILEVNHHRS
jgi:hypothetical protein